MGEGNVSDAVLELPSSGGCAGGLSALEMALATPTVLSRNWVQPCLTCERGSVLVDPLEAPSLLTTQTKTSLWVNSIL